MQIFSNQRTRSHKSPNEILVIGNGFDLASGYRTSYKDFLQFVYIADLAEIIERAQNGEPLREDVGQFVRDPHLVSLDNVRELKRLLGDSKWALYFRECKADKQGWIDLEREIVPVLHAFQWILSAQYSMDTFNHDGYAAFYNYPEDVRRTLGLWRNYFQPNGGGPILAHKNWSDPQYGLYKERIIRDLKGNFDEFKRMLALALDIVTQAAPVDHPIIRSLRADVVLNYNYTTTERSFDNLQGARVFHVHGAVDAPEKIVLGVDRYDDEQNRFIYWTKPFQRILTKQDSGYKTIYSDPSASPYAVTVFGHSLDPIDAHILSPLLDGATRITIYYHDGDEYEQKVVNLVKLLGQDEIEERVYQKRIVFKNSGALD